MDESAHVVANQIRLGCSNETGGGPEDFSKKEQGSHHRCGKDDGPDLGGLRA